MPDALKTQWTPDETLVNLFTKAVGANGVGYLQTLVDSINLKEKANFLLEKIKGKISRH